MIELGPTELIRLARSYAEYQTHFCPSWKEGTLYWRLADALEQSDRAYRDSYLHDRQVKTMAIGGYQITESSPGKVYIKDCDTGEGMTIAAAEVEDALARLWRERF